MEEELGEKMEILQRDLEQARAGARDTHQVEELKKVLGPGARLQVGMTPASLMRLCPGEWGCVQEWGFQASSQ